MLIRSVVITHSSHAYGNRLLINPIRSGPHRDEIREWRGEKPEKCRQYVCQLFLLKKQSYRTRRFNPPTAQFSILNSNKFKI